MPFTIVIPQEFYPHRNEGLNLLLDGYTNSGLHLVRTEVEDTMLRQLYHFGSDDPDAEQGCLVVEAIDYTSEPGAHNIGMSVCYVRHAKRIMIIGASQHIIQHEALVRLEQELRQNVTDAYDEHQAS